MQERIAGISYSAIIEGVAEMTAPTASEGFAHVPAVSREAQSPSSETMLLAQELTHRFNNDLAAMGGYIALTATRSSDIEVKTVLSRLLRRIEDIALLQRALQAPTTDRAIDAGEYLRGLCRCISRAKLQHRNIRLILRAASLTLKETETWRMGMIVSELINNAARHAFADRGGTIRVELRSRGHSIECSIADNGCGLVSVNVGGGMKIVRSLAAFLYGAVEYQQGESGTVAVLSFPGTQRELQSAGRRMEAATMNHQPNERN